MKKSSKIGRRIGRDKSEKVEDREPTKGDILFCWDTEDPMKDHCALYIGNRFFVEAMPVYGARCLSPALRPRIWNKYQWGYIEELYTEYTLEERREIIDKAVRWAMRRRGRRYQLWQFIKSANWKAYEFSDCSSLFWYCSELVWAAYMNAIDGKLNISDAPYLGGTRYGFVSVRSLLRSGKIKIYRTCDREYI